MRTLPTLSKLSVALFALGLAAACGKKGSESAMNPDLKRDLELASSASIDLASKQSAAQFPLTETPIASAPAPAKKIVKANGPKAIRSAQPTVKAQPEAVVAAETQDAQAEATPMAAAPTAETTMEPSAPAVPRPSPIPVTAIPGGNGGGSGGSTTGAVLGTIFGAVIRGGGVDDDHCDPNRGRRRPNAGSLPYPVIGVYGGGVMTRGGGMRPPGTYSRGRS